MLTDEEFIEIREFAERQPRTGNTVCRDDILKLAAEIDRLRAIETLARELAEALKALDCTACRPGDDGKYDDHFDDARQLSQAALAKACAAGLLPKE